jgi:hypothetical protein
VVYLSNKSTFSPKKADGKVGEKINGFPVLKIDSTCTIVIEIVNNSSDIAHCGSPAAFKGSSTAAINVPSPTNRMNLTNDFTILFVIVRSD